MIQPISNAHPSAAPADAGGTPVAARGIAAGKSGTGSQAVPGIGFGARMSLIAGESGSLPKAALPGGVLSGKAFPASPQAALSAAELNEPLTMGTKAEQGDDALPELTPEQWLLGMIDQQQTEIQARDSARLGGVTEEPLSDALPTSSIAEQADALLAWLPESLTGQQATAQADPFDALAGHGWQRAPVDAGAIGAPLPRMAAELNTGLTQAATTPQLAADVLAEPALEPLLSAAEPAEAGEPLTATVERGQVPQPQAVDRALKLQAPESKWGEQMLHALRENVDLQIQQKIQSATIRLDPPELGSMEILLSHESGRLNVQLSAANADVARLLQQTSDRLRQELVGQHFVQVNVQVGADSGGQQGQQRQRTALTGEELPQAARPHEQEQSRQSGRPRDVLITV